VYVSTKIQRAGNVEGKMEEGKVWKSWEYGTRGIWKKWICMEGAEGRWKAGIKKRKMEARGIWKAGIMKDGIVPSTGNMEGNMAKKYRSIR
jgi:hypothetical protein